MGVVLKRQMHTFNTRVNMFDGRQRERNEQKYYYDANASYQRNVAALKAGCGGLIVSYLRSEACYSPFDVVDVGLDSWINPGA